MDGTSRTWRRYDRVDARVEKLIRLYRRTAVECLQPLVEHYYPALIAAPGDEYRKMLELSAKMTVVGHACTEIAGFPFDSRRRMIGSLYGGCCFLADSFIDDFGPKATRDYLERFELLLTKGWFEIRTDREKLFYIIISRLFSERDVLQSVLRQAIVRLHEAQKNDVAVRSVGMAIHGLPRRRMLELLRECARNRSGHAIIVLGSFLVPELSLRQLSLIFRAGELIMHIDDHGDHHSDRYYGRATYMNQVKNPAGPCDAYFIGECGASMRDSPRVTGKIFYSGSYSAIIGRDSRNTRFSGTGGRRPGRSMNRRNPSRILLGDQLAVYLQELREEGKLKGDHPLLRIDNATEAAKAPYQFDTVRARLHRNGCTAIPRGSRSALLARWDVSPEESKLGCRICRPLPTGRTTMERNLASDILFGVVSILDQFGNVLRERGKEYRNSAQGRELANGLEGLYASLGA